MTYPMAPFELHRPSTVTEAVELAEKYPGAPYLAGGTDLMVNLRKRLAEPEHVISLGGVEELRGIGAEKGAVIIGAMTPMEMVAADPTVASKMPVLTEAAALVAGPTLRAMGTLGGNLMLDTRCLYYNQSYFWRQANDFCLKKDGTVCHVAPGGKFCWAAFSADTPAALLVLDAQVELTGPKGSRTVPVPEIYGADGRWPVGGVAGGLEPGELLVRVRIPLPEKGWQATYQKIRVRDSIDFPLAGVALSVKRAGGDSGNVTGLKLALTGVNPRPLAVDGLDDLLNREMDVDWVGDLAKKANRAAKPMRSTVADPAYRRAMVGALIEKAAARLSPDLAATLLEQARWDQAG